MLNRVILMGRLTADPELKKTPSDISVVAFSVAVDRKFGKAQERQADFINCVAWRQTAEFISRYFAKGRMIALEGSLQTRTYVDKSETKRYITEVVVDSAYFADSKPGGGSQPSIPLPTDAPPVMSEPMSYSSGALEDFEEIKDEDDLPF